MGPGVVMETQHLPIPENQPYRQYTGILFQPG